MPDPTPALEQSLAWQKKVLHILTTKLGDKFLVCFYVKSHHRIFNTCQVAKQADAELEVQQLRETLEEYNKEFVDVKNQVNNSKAKER